MPQFRINHMELTVPPGTFAKDREVLTAFYKEVFDFDVVELPTQFDGFGASLLMSGDKELSQFLLLNEQEQCMQAPGYDHLGFLFDTRAAVDEKLNLCKQWKQKDARVKVKEYADLHAPATVVHAFYVKFLLPVWFDVQVVEYREGAEPTKRWIYA